MAAGSVVCPLCGYAGNGEYEVQLHIEERHTEDSPFVPNDAASGPDLRVPPLPPRPGSGATTHSSRPQPPGHDDTLIKCTRPNCGEYVNVTEIQEHLEFHEAAALSEDDDKTSNGSRSDNPPLPRDARTSSIAPHGEFARPQSRSQAPLRESVSAKGPRSSHVDAASTASLQVSQKRPRSSNPPSPNNSPQKAQRPRNIPSNNNSSHSSQFRPSILQYFAGTSSKGPPDHRDSRPGLLPNNYQQRRLRAPLEPGRLGKRELGPHAFEEVMPADVRTRLLHDAAPRERAYIGRDGRILRFWAVPNETADLIPLLRDLCASDPAAEITYLCHPSVRHVEKLRCEGNFCGYWNIQMILSYVHDRDARVSGTQAQGIPDVLQIQNTIERAWDNDICPYGRIETGGVRGTRKWIGTHEAVAFFTQIKVDVEALSFKTEPTNSRPASGISGSSSSNSNGTQLAVTQLLDHIEAYFISGLESAEQHRTSYVTGLPPIYFQRFGHSMTIVGLERKRNGGRNLLLFDPSFGTSGAVHKLLQNKRVGSGLDALLRPYRRSEYGLSRWDEFEVIVPKMTEVQEVQSARPNSSG